ncbi:hypothetical protein BOX15_Mlig017616g4 [Macrostomum lignano]|uniref:UPF0506 domain-containing protein n=2 Tax=Macrostomum lignano TaxID=282301 RepID=A0A1I8IQJ6_9PLAT|nr:hypothetical protein BOX15_Mlig017616g4 [Macrostomum lignano]
MAQPRLQTLLLLLIVTLLYVMSGQSSAAEAACLAKGHLCVSFRQCCSGYCLPINASNRYGQCY